MVCRFARQFAVGPAAMVGFGFAELVVVESVCPWAGCSESRLEAGVFPALASWRSAVCCGVAAGGVDVSRRAAV